MSKEPDSADGVAAVTEAVAVLSLDTVPVVRWSNGETLNLQVTSFDELRDAAANAFKAQKEWCWFYYLVVHRDPATRIKVDSNQKWEEYLGQPLRVPLYLHVVDPAHRMDEGHRYIGIVEWASSSRHTGTDEVAPVERCARQLDATPQPVVACQCWAAASRSHGAEASGRALARLQRGEAALVLHFLPHVLEKGSDHLRACHPALKCRASRARRVGRAVASHRPLRVLA